MTFTEAERAERRLGIGASEVAAIVGLSPWKTALDVYREKTGEALPSPDSDAASWGRALERPVADHYYQAMKKTVPALVMHQGTTIRHEHFPWAYATPDRVLTSFASGRKDIWLLEVKTRSWRTADVFGLPGTNEVGDEVFCQVQWQMFVTGETRCDVALLVDGRDFRVYTVMADERAQQHLLTVCSEFWKDLQARIPPAPATLDDASKLYELSVGSDLAEPDETVAAAVKGYADARVRRDEAQAELDRHELAIKTWLGDRPGVQVGGVKVSWRSGKPRQVVDYKGLSAAAEVSPALLDLYTKEVPGARQFRVTLPAEEA